MDTPGPSGTPTSAESGIYVTSAGRSRNMAAIRRKDTKPEVELRSALHRLGYRFRKDYPIRVDGKLLRPDIAFTRQKIAIFIDGCFWHCCPQHGHQPNVNADYWSLKLQGNVARDRKQTATLQDAGWQVVRFWEHEDLDRVISDLATLIRKR
ncbi:very short patch repair endonuclease [Mycobacteroides abscessus]|uniref:very short patch repair endonuclease n=1 Tax=Mycobacteroides abscessus TaxID=36809 RepID=UPI00094071B0|nr:very short patch repair endonuclease [Mycobacteroides abscessus]